MRPGSTGPLTVLARMGPKTELAQALVLELALQRWMVPAECPGSQALLAR